MRTTGKLLLTFKLVALASVVSFPPTAIAQTSPSPSAHPAGEGSAASKKKRLQRRLSLMESAWNLYRDGQYREAINVYRNAEDYADDNSDLSEILLYQGIAYFHFDQSNARVAFRRALIANRGATLPTKGISPKIIQFFQATLEQVQREEQTARADLPTERPLNPSPAPPSASPPKEPVPPAKRASHSSGSPPPAQKPAPSEQTPTGPKASDIPSPPAVPPKAPLRQHAQEFSPPPSQDPTEAWVEPGRVAMVTGGVVALGGMVLYGLSYESGRTSGMEAIGATAAFAGLATFGIAFAMGLGPKKSPDAFGQHNVQPMISIHPRGAMIGTQVAF
jgi:hypothetical protein